MNFVSSFLDFTRERESPSNFWKWSAFATIAATLRDNVYYDYGDRIYPNIYVVLLADSAEYRKGAGISLAADLLSTINNTKRIRGRTTAQGILSELSQDIGSGKQVPIRGGSCILLADELASFFINDPQLIEMLTDIHDSSGRHEWDYNLRSTGKIVIKQPCVSMLAASNETLFREVYSNKAVYGGLLGRTLLIKPDETRKSNSLVTDNGYNLSQNYLNERKELITRLEEIKKLNGPVKFSKDAAECYNYWYHDLYKKYKTHPDKTGVTQRMHTNVVKLGIIIAASKCSLEISRETIEEAILSMVSLKQNYEVYAMTTGRSDLATPGAILLNVLWGTKDNEISKRELLFNYWNQISADELDKVVMAFLQSEMIVEVYKGNEVSYRLTKKAIDAYNSKLGELGPK